MQAMTSSRESCGYCSSTCSTVMPNASRSKIRDTQIRCPLMQGLPKQTLGSIEIFFSSSLRSITPDSARDSSLIAITLAGAWSRMEPNAWHFEIDPYPDGEKALRYNRREPVLG